MEALFGLLIIVGLTLAAKSAIDRTKGGYQKSRDARVKEAAKAYPKGSLPKSQRNAVARRHAVGYWGREAAHGFPVTRTGWHVGRAAHRKAHEQGRQARSEAETQHVEAQAARRQAVAGHRERQAEARRQIEGILTTEPNAKGKKAVRKAAEAVVLRPDFPSPPATDVPPLPAEVGKPEPGPYAPKPDEKPTRRVDGQPETEADKRAFDERESGYDGPLNRDGRRPDMDDPQEAEAVAALDGMRQRAENEPGPDAATWSPETAPQAMPSPATNGDDMASGERSCALCGGTGRNHWGDDACPACRGFGSAPADLESPEAAPDAVCTACGNPGRSWDPVLDAPGGLIHESHAIEQQAAYNAALIRADIATPSPASNGNDAQRHDRPTGTGGRDIWTEDADWTAVPTESPATNGASTMPATDTTYTEVLKGAQAAVAQSDQDTAQIAARKKAAFDLADAMVAANVDPAVIDAQMQHADNLDKAEKALADAGESASATASSVERYHGGVQEAVDSAPGKIAERQFHEGS